MGRAPCCSKVGLHRGPWTPREDTLLSKYIQAHGEGHWRCLPKKAGLLRCGKSCRLRWMNYLRPDIKRGNITPEEEDLIIRMHSLLGNRWSLIAGRLPGRTDNEIKNYWNTHLSKRLRRQGTDPKTHKELSESEQPQKKITRKTSNKKKQANKDEPEKHKVHLPKPVRVASFSRLPRHDSFEHKATSGNSSQEKGGFGAEDLNVPCWGSKDGGYHDDDHDNDNAVGFLIGADHQDLVNGSDFDCQSDLPTTDNSLEMLYDEYLQLLKSDESQIELASLDETFVI